MEAIRVTDKEWEIAGVHYVRTEAMCNGFGVSLEMEFGEDKAGDEYILVLDGIHPVSTCRLHQLDENTGKIERVATLNEVIRTMVKLLLNKDIGTPVDISDGAIKGENRKILEAANGQSGIDNIKKMEEEILTLVDANKEGALEKALVFYGYLNELPEDELLSGNYSHEKIKKGLKMVAEHYGILNVIDLIYR